MNAFDPENIESARAAAAADLQRHAEGTDDRRVELARQRAEAAGRTIAALGAAGGKLATHVTRPAAGVFARIGQAIPWMALGLTVGGGAFLVYAVLRRGPAQPVVVVASPSGRDRKTKKPRKNNGPT